MAASIPTGHPRARGEERSASTAMRWRSACSLARKSPWLASQPRDFADALLDTGRLRDLAANTVVIAADGEETGLHFLVHGCVQVSVPRAHQELSLAHIHLPGEWFGEISSLARQKSPAEYRTRGRCVTLSVSRMDLILLQQTNQAAASALLELIAATASRLLEVTADAAGLDPPGRVIAKLLSLSASASGSAGGDACSLPVTQVELAELCSVSRTTVAKVIGELEASGAVLCSYGQIHILGRGLLAATLGPHFRSAE